MPRAYIVFGLAIAVLNLQVQLADSAETSEVDFNRDIKPLLSDICFQCHGPDKNKREADLRLDVRDDAISAKAIVPGKPDESEIVKRLFSSDPEQVMPPPKFHKQLTRDQRELLRRWVAEGAEYQTHWAYSKTVRPQVPDGVNGIDFLVQQRLRKFNLQPSPEADRRTLARRLSFDLIGLPPKPEDVDAFLNDSAPDAYGKYVEQLLASRHYGERMAIGWLDVVRFADTIGYHSDNPRNVWPYRDYVIASFNQNKRFDQFTIEQLAGDLLPNSTQEHKVASCFNRLLLTTEEGGAQAKDYEVRYLTDRVRAVGTVWLGQTIGCCQCHDHKFDPGTQRDFYSLGAFFADIQEPIIGRREDGMAVPSPEQVTRLAELQAAVAELQQQFNAPHPQLSDAFKQWEIAQTELARQESHWITLRPDKAESTGGSKLNIQPDNAVLATGPKPDKDTYKLGVTGELKSIVGLRIEALPDASLPSQGPGRAGNGNFVLTEVIARVRRADGQTKDLAFAAARATVEQTIGGDANPYKAWTAASVIDRDEKGDGFGWAVLPEVGKPQQLVLELAEPVSVDVGDSLELELKQNHGHGSHTLGRFKIAATSDAEAARTPLAPAPTAELANLLKVSDDQRDQPQRDKLFAQFKNVAPELADLRKNIAASQKAVADFEASLPKCLISVSMTTPRTVRLLPRGNWMDDSGPIMQPAFPAFMPQPQTEGDRRLNRLDLAQWVVSRDNPLTARVFMNRLWKQFFGIGLSKVLDDLGAQGEPPVNSQLLDWLAIEFMDSGWDVKHMVRLIANSQTYKQVSTASKELQARDPDNRELARQSRFRLDAEFVRDNALAVSGLLVSKVGGPSVKPYQPDGYWENLNFPTRTWVADTGENQYRRGMYTWWQRSFPHPSLLAFDAPSREECAADRNRSNIPQQALVLLNDPTYVEAARAFAARILESGGSDTASRLTWAYRQALSRPPRDEELQHLQSLIEQLSAQYSADGKAAEAVLKVGLAPNPDTMRQSELATWTNVARVIFNLHEFVTRG